MLSHVVNVLECEMHCSTGNKRQNYCMTITFRKFWLNWVKWWSWNIFLIVFCWWWINNCYQNQSQLQLLQFFFCWFSNASLPWLYFGRTHINMQRLYCAPETLTSCDCIFHMWAWSYHHILNRSKVSIKEDRERENKRKNITAQSLHCPVI